jgi:hypothetical protein
MTKSNKSANLISIETKGTVTVTRRYDGNRYNDARLQACASDLTKSLKNHKTAVNEFIRQAVFKVLSSKNVSEAFDSLYKEIGVSYTPEIKKLFVLSVKHFKGQLPPQSELDALDCYMLLTPPSKKTAETEHGKMAVLSFIKDRINKLSKSKKDYAKDESDAWTVCLNALEDSLKK